MNRSDKMKEMEVLWRSKMREVDWDEIDWEKGKYGDLGKLFDLVDVVASEIYERNAFSYLYGEREEKQGRYSWNYWLATDLFAWLNLPEDSLSPFLWDEKAGLACIPQPEVALNLARLFEGPSSFTLGIEGLSEKLKERRHRRRRSQGSGLSKEARIAFLAPKATTKDHALTMAQ